MLTTEQLPIAGDATAGRQTVHTDEEYRKYWSLSDSEKQEFLKNEYAQRNATDPYATSRDYNARELEIDSIARHLDRKGQVVDLGCGNGYTLISLAKSLDQWDLLGLDFSENLIQGACELLEKRKAELRSHPQFVCADALEFLKKRESGSVDYLITERFVQNMPSREVQQLVIREAFRVLSPGGKLLLCEGSEDGFEALNDLRASVGLSRVPATSKENVSAIRFRDQEVEEFAREVGFDFAAKAGYSTYFIITRVLHPLLVAPRSPQFDAKINDFAREIQMHAPQTPGYGSNVLWVFQKPGGAPKA